jgi:hypothetical protein
MYIEKQLIDFANYVLSCKTEVVTDAQLGNWKETNNLPIVDEGTDLYDRPCIIDFETGQLEGVIKKQHAADKFHSYDVQVLMPSGKSKRFYNLDRDIVKIPSIDKFYVQ